MSTDGRRARSVRVRGGAIAVVLVASLVGCASDGPRSSRPTPPTTPTTPTAPTTPSAPTATGAGTTAPPAPPVAVTLFGDSMSDEARTDLLALAPGAGIDLRLVAEGKAAPCSQLQPVLDELARADPPPVVAVQWMGNARFSAGCSRAFDPDEVVAEYATALDRIEAVRPPGTTVVLVGIPPVDIAPWSSTRGPLDQLYRERAAHPGVAYVDTTTALAPAGTFTRTLPCAAPDRATGACGRYGAAPDQVVVRDELGLHFCPVPYELDVADCPVASPGSRRYARAVVDGLAAAVAAGPDA